MMCVCVCVCDVWDAQANKISFFFNLKGPSMSIDTACSSSLIAFDRAMKDIQLGVIDRYTHIHHTHTHIHTSPTCIRIIRSIND